MYRLCYVSVGRYKNLILSDRRAKLGKIQGGLQRGSQDLTKDLQSFFKIFYPIKIFTFRVFTLSD